MTRTITLEPGVRTLVFRRRFSSLPQVFEFSAAAVNGGSVAGTIERVGSRWILGRTHSSSPLLVQNEVRKGYWDTFFEVFVTAAVPVQVVVPRARLSHRVLIGALVVAVIVAAGAAMYLAR